MANIVLIAGSPASGKSTLARALAERADKGLHIPVDELRSMVVGGAVHPGPDWSEELRRQLVLARASAAQMALRYRKAGFLVAIDDFWDPFSGLAEYEALAAQPQVLRVLLRPDKQVVLARNHARRPPSDFRNTLDDGIEQVYADLEQQASRISAQGWHVFDTSTETAEASLIRIQSLLGPRNA
jgi:predicted kinase